MDWHTLRDEFPVTRKYAFFDHAAVAPITGRARQALISWANDMAETGDFYSHLWIKRVEDVRRLAGIKVVVLPDALFQSISGTETSQGVMALVKPPVWKLEQLFRGCPLVVVLDGLQDPGNAGAIVRAAEAFGATGVLFLKGTVSPYNSKTLRASAGSLFRTPYLHGVDPVLARASLRQHKVELYAGVPAGLKIIKESYTGMYI